MPSKTDIEVIAGGAKVPDNHHIIWGGVEKTASASQSGQSASSDKPGVPVPSDVKFEKYTDSSSAPEDNSSHGSSHLSEQRCGNNQATPASSSSRRKESARDRDRQSETENAASQGQHAALAPEGAAFIDVKDDCFPEVADLGDLPSRGAFRHESNKCRPCYFVHRSVGCDKGKECLWCHYKHTGEHNKTRLCKSKRDRYRKLTERKLERQKNLLSL